MNQITGKLPREAVQRRLQDTEDKVIDEDEEVEADRNINNPSCPKTDLKRDTDEVFTKKMIQPVSNSSMVVCILVTFPQTSY